MKNTGLTWGNRAGEELKRERGGDMDLNTQRVMTEETQVSRENRLKVEKDTWTGDTRGQTGTWETNQDNHKGG